MLVHIVYVPDADLRGPDLDRINRVEDVPDEVGRLMLGDGAARTPTDVELAAYQESLKAAVPAATVDETAAVSPRATKARDKQTDAVAETAQ